MNIRRLTGRRILIVGGACAAVVGAVILKWSWPVAKAEATNGAAGSTDYLTTIAAVESPTAGPVRGARFAPRPSRASSAT